MKPENFDIWSGIAPIGDGKTETAAVSISVYRPTQPNGAAMIICPGGGYGTLVMGGEGNGIARWLNHHSITGVVLAYRLPKGRPFVPLLDAQRAIRLVRANATPWNLNPQCIGIIGFSAGGHLAATAATHFDAGNLSASDRVEQFSCRPDFSVLIYPVITMGEKNHGGSKANLLGPLPTPALIDLFSNEKQVTAQTPPAFLAHAKDDQTVDCANSQMFHDELRAHGVAGEYLKLPAGGHGFNGYKGPAWDAWQSQSLRWLAAQKFIPTP